MNLDINDSNLSALLAASKQASTTYIPPTQDEESWDDIIGEPDPTVVASNAKLMASINKELAKQKVRRKSLADFPSVVQESDDPNVLIKGAWLEKGCGAFLVSTAGTGKSIWMTQFSLSMTMGVSFSGLTPYRPLSIWVIQSEDSPRRVAVDREDIIAGLTEDYPEYNWRAAAKKVIFLQMTGSTGATFLKQLRDELTVAKQEGEVPDVVIINPYMAFMGGDISVNRDNSAFLRGGNLGGEKTEGLQSILEDFHVAALIAHHTGKPPSEKEIASWIKNSMPEYQCCGASDITNWGRSFITMMKMPGIDSGVMLTAGKNGGGLRWPTEEGARRIFLAHGGGTSSNGSDKRHYWRKPTDEEIEQFREAIMPKGSKSLPPSKPPLNLHYACNFLAKKVEEYLEIPLQDLSDFVDDYYKDRTRKEKRELLDAFKQKVQNDELGIILKQGKHNYKTYIFVGNKDDEEEGIF